MINEKWDKYSHVSERSSFGRIFSLARHLPYAQLNLPNPVLEYEWNRARTILSADDLAQFTLTVGCTIPGLSGFVACCMFWVLMLDYNNLLEFSLLLSILLIALCNVYYAVVATTQIFQHYGPEFRDALRLTPLSKEEIVLAQHTMIQIRVWKVMVIEIGLRLIIVIISSPVVLLLHRLADTGIPFHLVILWVTAMLGIAVAFIYEPLWRMRTATSLSITIATRMNNVTLAIASSVTVMFVLQFMLIVSGFVVIFEALTAVFQNSDSAEQLRVFLALSVGCSLAILYPGYKFLQRVALHYYRVAANLT